MTEMERIRITELTLKSLEDQISEEEFTELDSYVSSSKENAHYFTKCIATYMGIMEYHEVAADKTCFDNASFDQDLWDELAEHERTAPAIEIPKEKPKKELVKMLKIEKTPRVVSKFSLYTLVVSSAAMLFLAVWVWMTPVNPLVATLTSDVNAKWLNEDSVLEEDGSIRAGKLMLAKGMAKIDFCGGARIILQSPAEVEFISQDKIYISRGQLVASVGRDAIGFIVDTPNAKTLDLGTEFGVEVSRNGDTAVHVFQGEVAIYPGNSEDKILIEQGKAKQVNYNGNIRDLPAKESTFVRADEFDANLKADQGDPYYRWLSYSYQLRRDPSLVAYYTFEKDDDNPDKLKNIAVATADRCDGLLLSENDSQLPKWTQGRWPNKTALEFDRSKKQMVEVSNDPALNITGPVTLSAWISCPDFEEGGGGLIVSNRTRDNINYQMSYGIHSGVSRKNVIAFGRYKKYADLKIESQNLSLMPDTWHHVVVTHDNREVRCYIDGRLFDVKPHIFRHSPVEAELLLGAAKNYINDLSDRMFNGIMGEVAIFKRVLSEEDIAAMYEAGKPK